VEKVGGKEPSQKLVDELFEYLRIPSISSGGGDPADMTRAAEWLAARIRDSGGEVEIITDLGNPLVVGELEASTPSAPTVMIYGHYDVQSPDPVDAWTTPPFDPTIRNGRLYARGACDDKGNFYPLVYVACELARAGKLPVNVRMLIEGEEEVGGTSAIDWLMKDGRGADCCLVFDSGMLDESTPAITLGVRGVISFAVDVRVAQRDLHSGMYGGAALNAVHVLQQMLNEVLPAPDGSVREELRAGIIPPTSEELASWAKFRHGSEAIAEGGGRAISDAVSDIFYERNWADTSVDVNGIAGGDAVQKRTIIPATAQAKFSIRLAPGQTTSEIGREAERLLRAAAPANADVEISWDGGEPAVFDPSSPAMQLAIEALAEVCGVAPALVRVGGSIPVLAGFYDRKIPTVLSGFGLASDAFHAVDESFRLESLALCEASAHALYEKLASLE
jgi:acetylornithine deacetylase/succinyl-diaminopimelate desuccinylase-like protein